MGRTAPRIAASHADAPTAAGDRPLVALDAALALATRGFHVFPLSGRRVPLIKGWPRLATTRAGQIAAWWGRFGAAAVGVGVACGPSDLVVLDMDPRNGGERSLGRLLLEHGDAWLRTVAVRTPRGGWHWYFAAQGREIAGGNERIAPGIDVKARGGFVVAPHSVGEHGPYVWADGGSPDDSPLLPLPEWLRARCTPTARTPPSRAKAGTGQGVARVRDISYSCYSLPGMVLSPAVLRGVVRDRGFEAVATRFLAIPDVSVGVAFACVLRDDDDRPSAALWRDPSGLLVYHDFRADGTPTAFLTLTEVFAARVTGAVAKLAAPAHATWLLRLLAAMQVLDRAPVALPALPPHASAGVRTVYAGYRLLLGCKWRYAPDAPTAFTVRFAAGRCGVSAATAQKAIRTLVAMGVIVRADIAKVRGRTLPLYLPNASQTVATAPVDADAEPFQAPSPAPVRADHTAA